MEADDGFGGDGADEDMMMDSHRRPACWLNAQQQQQTGRERDGTGEFLASIYIIYMYICIYVYTSSSHHSNNPG